MSYEERLRAHLAKYKFRVLRVLESGAVKGARTGVVAKRPYILPAEAIELNILAPFRERFWAEFAGAGGTEARKLELQRDFAHLTSSQALCFNLFYPLVADRSWAETFVQGVLGLKKATPKRLAFEYVEDPEEATHFDFFAELEGGGMPTPLLSRPFEPLATAEGGKIAGLGLHIVERCMRQAGGRVELASERSGTRVKLYLPAAK